MPDQLYKGKSYAEWIADWTNWLFSVNPDDHNSGPVVFLKHVPPIRKQSSSNNQVEEGEEINGKFMKSINVMIGEDVLDITEGQAILIPILVSYWSAEDPEEDEEVLRQKVRDHTAIGDNPPETKQLTISSIPTTKNAQTTQAILFPGMEMKDFKLETSVFPLIVPKSEYGTTYKDYVDTPFMQTGTFATVTLGYFVLISDIKVGTYFIHSYSKGAPTRRGDYHAELLYQIRVNGETTKNPQSKQSTIISEKITQILKKKIRQHKGELEPTTNTEDVVEIISQSRN